jgi:hypothetical protein
MDMYCDLNGDGSLETCEIFDCITMAENGWRAVECPEYGDAYCVCPFDVASCEGHWECD